VLVEVEWDEGKARANIRKHGVRFAEAADALRDELAITRTDERAGEVRFVTIGSDMSSRILQIVYAWRGKSIRLISARYATRSEIRKYREGL